MAAKYVLRDRDAPSGSKASPRVFLALVAAILAAVVAGAFVLSTDRQPAGRDAGADPDIRPFIESYFLAWSAGDMKAYGELFAPSARIDFVEAGGTIQGLDRDPFVAQQTKAIADSPVRMVEHMTTFSVQADEKAAQVAAGWELRKGPEVYTGVDRFTLVRDGQGKWKISYLVFYSRDAR